MSLSLIDSIYSDRADIIIGLTGRTGSGCSTIANIMETRTFDEFHLAKHTLAPNANKLHSYEEDLKSNIIFDFMSHSDSWSPFTVIDMSSIIFSFVLEGGQKVLIDYIENLLNKSTKEHRIEVTGIQELKKIIHEGSDHFSQIKNFSLNTQGANDSDLINYYCHTLNASKKYFKKAFSDYKILETTQSKFTEKQTTIYNLYSYLMQRFGNNLRKSNDYSNDDCAWSSYALLQRVEQLISIFKNQNKPVRLCINAIRNPFEINYFRERYVNYYTLSVNVEDDVRIKRLHHMSLEELENLDKVEYPEAFDSDQAIFYHQDIKSCIENADIHLHNPEDPTRQFVFVKEQLVKYISLIIHPGLVTPARVESCMQLAYNTKLNSGCLSRQVGAVITDSNYSVKAVGWNDVPQGQLSCNLRDITTYCTNQAPQMYSEYENHNAKFREAMTALYDCYTSKNLHGLQCRYCFKDIFNSIQKDKNQVHTRSLHAEENSFLQLSKYGGSGIENGKLFVTASPCELCSKKSYQLGIKDIYYIDPYPGIARTNILKSGFQQPQIHLFYGAVGNAFIKLYKPKFAYKDELKFRTNVNQKAVVNNLNKVEVHLPDLNDLNYELVEIEMNFKSRLVLETRNLLRFVPMKPIQTLEKSIIWTGEPTISLQIKSSSSHCKIRSLGTGQSNKIYAIEYDHALSMKNPESLELLIHAKDANQHMSPYIAHRIRNRTKILNLILSLPNSCTFVDKNSIYKVTYADFNMEQVLEKKPLKINRKTKKYIFSVKNPNINYCYCIEWDFC